MGIFGSGESLLSWWGWSWTTRSHWWRGGWSTRLKPCSKHHLCDELRQSRGYQPPGHPGQVQNSVSVSGADLYLLPSDCTTTGMTTVYNTTQHTHTHRSIHPSIHPSTVCQKRLNWTWPERWPDVWRHVVCMKLLHRYNASFSSWLFPCCH